VQQKLPRAFAGEARGALCGETIVAGAIVQADPAKTALTVLLVTPTRLLHVDKKETRSWQLAEVAVTDYQQQATAQLAALAVLAGDEVLRFLIPRGEQAQDLHAVFRQLRALNNDVVVARVSELPWWERKAAWPYAALGRVAGGTTPLIQGQHGSLGLGRRGVSIYLGNSTEPSLQVRWQDVTEVLVEPPSELKARVSAEQLLLLGVLAWGLETTEGETFVTVTTKNQDLYFAVQAPVTELRGFWGSVLAHFAVDSDEVAVPASTITLPSSPISPEPEADLVSRLERLAALHATGALTQEEYTAAKAAVIKGR
jgi:hypothetical protein